MRLMITSERQLQRNLLIVELLTRQTAYLRLYDLPPYLLPELLLIYLELKGLDTVYEYSGHTSVIPPEEVFTRCNIDLLEDKRHILMHSCYNLSRIFTEGASLFYVSFNPCFHGYLTPLILVKEEYR